MTYSIKHIGGVFTYEGYPIADQDWAKKVCWASIHEKYFSASDYFHGWPFTDSIFQVELSGRWEKREIECRLCDGCGWYEGGPTLKTKCAECDATGIVRTEMLFIEEEGTETRDQGEKETEMSEAWVAWTEDQKTNPEAVNPYAFVYGWKCCKNRMLKLGMVNLETAESREELWHDLFKLRDMDYDDEYIKSKFTIHKKV